MFMYKTDLLEKNQQYLFKILEILYLNGAPVTKQSLTKQLEISPATLKHYLEDLQTDVQPLIDEKKSKSKLKRIRQVFKCSKILPLMIGYFFGI
ncbi:HTH domain-containing protein [Pediococcus ethanolidurans]|nr:HTH domain-containing protein [Pediococcus ethanolidurans]